MAANVLKLGKLLAINLLVLSGLLVVVEGGLQVVALVKPSHDVLFLQPDKVLGWKMVPDHSFRWTGHDWYASEFDVQVSTNRLGFRDKQREPAKPVNVKRIAVLGDSFIEAIQVPAEETATQVLETALNDNAKGATAKQRREVLNFGVSNYGVGQYLLTWREHAAAHGPDYVAGLHMRRTVEKFEQGVLGASRAALNVRPTFALGDAGLTLEPALHYQAFVDAQDNAIRSGFDGQRSRRKTRLIVPIYASKLKAAVARRLLPDGAAAGLDDSFSASTLDVNAAILRELAAKVSEAGARFVVLDVSGHFGDAPSVSQTLARVCRETGAICLEIHRDLVTAEAEGVPTAFRGDKHFNAAGNRIVAQSMFHWLSKQGQP